MSPSLSSMMLVSMQRLYYPTIAINCFNAKGYWCDSIVTSLIARDANEAELCAIDPSLILASDSKVSLNLNRINHMYLDTVNKCRGRQSWLGLIKCMKVDRQTVQISHDLVTSYAK